MATFLIVLPAALLLLLTAVQVGLWALAAHAVSLAASQGGLVARAYGSSPAAGATEARATLSELSGNLLATRSVSAATTAAGQLSLTVAGQVVSLLPGIHLHVSATSAGPAQRFQAAP